MTRRVLLLMGVGDGFGRFAGRGCRWARVRERVAAVLEQTKGRSRGPCAVRSDRYRQHRCADMPNAGIHEWRGERLTIQIEHINGVRAAFDQKASESCTETAKVETETFRTRS